MSEVHVFLSSQVGRCSWGSVCGGAGVVMHVFVKLMVHIFFVHIYLTQIGVGFMLLYAYLCLRTGGIMWCVFWSNVIWIWGVYLAQLRSNFQYALIVLKIDWNDPDNYLNRWNYLRGHQRLIGVDFQHAAIGLKFERNALYNNLNRLNLVRGPVAKFWCSAWLSRPGAAGRWCRARDLADKILE